MTEASGPATGVSPAAEPVRRPRVAMLVRNSGQFDTRVRKEAKAVQRLGADVLVIAATDDSLPVRETLDGVRYRRIESGIVTLYRARDRYLERHELARQQYLRRQEAWSDARAQRRERYLSAVAIARGQYITWVKGRERPGSRVRRRARDVYVSKVRSWRDAVAGSHGMERVVLQVRSRLGGVALRAALGLAYALISVVSLVLAPVESFRRYIRRAWFRIVRRWHRLLLKVEYRCARPRRRLNRVIWLVQSRMQRLRWKIVRRALLAIKDLLYFSDYRSGAQIGLREFGPDLVHAHDLNTLWPGVLYGTRHRVPVVYDAHELETHRNLVWTRRKKLVWNLVEGALVRRVDAVITVSPQIASFLSRKYRISAPTVVLNSPSLPNGQSSGPSLHEMCDLTPDAYLFAYVGKLAPGRGVEEVVSALTHLDSDYHLAIIGPRNDAYDLTLMDLAKRLGVEDRFYLLDPVPPHLVPAALRTVVASVNASQNVCKSYDLALPNKLFDTVMAGVPTAVGSLRAMAEFVTRHQIGVVFDEEDPASIAAAIRNLAAKRPEGIADPARLSALQQEVCWEAQEQQLATVYEALLQHTDHNRK